MKRHRYNHAGRRLADSRQLSGRALTLIIILFFIAAVLFSTFWKN